MLKPLKHLACLVYLSASAQTANNLTYTNTTYRFHFSLPTTWTGYATLTDCSWRGTLLSPSGAEALKQVEGPGLAIRNPLWTQTDPHEDIPIYIFTRAQWSLIERERLAIGAAPIPPSQLGRNTKYVFALPARYNFDYSTGWHEVENIVATKPLQPF